MFPKAISRSASFMRWVSGGLSTLLYPSRCRVCSAELTADEGPYFCERCDASIAPARVTGEAESYRIMPEYIPSYIPAHACFPYERAAETAVKLLKYEGKTVLVRTIGGAVGALMSLIKWTTGADVAVAVPLHPRRRRERGFDQSRLIARRAAGQSNIPPAYDGVIERKRNTVPQVTLTGAARLANIAGAFTADARFFAGRRVVLIDDVITTGATMNEEAGGTVAAAVAFAAPGLCRDGK